MVRFVIALGVMALLGFMLWCFLPMFTAMNTIINSTIINSTALGTAQWKLMPFAIAGIVIVVILYLAFRDRRGEE